jgi:hypothetical protein
MPDVPLLLSPLILHKNCFSEDFGIFLKIIDYGVADGASVSDLIRIQFHLMFINGGFSNTFFYAQAVLFGIFLLHVNYHILLSPISA